MRALRGPCFIASRLVDFDFPLSLGEDWFDKLAYRDFGVFRKGPEVYHSGVAGHRGSGRAGLCWIPPDDCRGAGFRGWRASLVSAVRAIKIALSAFGMMCVHA